MKLVLPLVLLITLLVGAVWLDDPQEPADLVFVNRGELHTLDPQRMSWLQDFRIAYNIYEGLVRWDNDTFDILPAGAMDWDISEDGLTYTFDLRPECQWSNGDAMTAHDYVYSWKRALLPDTAADYTDLFYRLKGGEAYFNWRADQLKAYQKSDTPKTTAAAKALRDEADAKFAEMVGVRAIDDHTLEVVLQRPTPYILDLFAFPVFYPVHRETVEAFLTIDPETGMLRQRHGWTKPGVLVSNGPYVLAVWRYKRDLRLERNPFYWNTEAVVSDSVASISIEEASTSVLAFETGTIDWLSDVSGVEYRADMLLQAKAYRDRHAGRIAQLRDEFIDLMKKQWGDKFDAKYGSRLNEPYLGYDWIMATLERESPPQENERNNIHSFPAYGTYFYNFNCNERFNDGRLNPFHDAKVRRGFALATDKQAIVEKVTRLNQPVASTFTPPGSIPGYQVPKGLGYDPDAGRALLVEAGWEDRDGDGLIENENGDLFPIVKIMYETSGGNEYIAQAIAAMWESELGVRTATDAQESKITGERKKNHDFIVSRANWFGDYGDPTTFLDLFRTTNGNNDRAYSNEYFDDLMARSDNEPDPEKRMRMLEEAEAFIMNDQLPLLPLFHRITVYMYEPTVLENVSHHPRLTQYLWELRANR